MSSTSSDPSNPTSTLADGDTAAREGRWSDAVTIWASLRAGTTTDLADERLRWFLSHTGTVPDVTPQTSQTSWPTILCAAGLGLFGTAIVLLGEGVSGSLAIVTSIAAWACYLASGILIVMYAHARHVAERDRDHLDARRMTAAIDAAKALDVNAAHPDHPHS